jgi:hypothetical protein
MALLWILASTNRAEDPGRKNFTPTQSSVDSCPFWAIWVVGIAAQKSFEVTIGDKLLRV